MKRPAKNNIYKGCLPSLHTELWVITCFCDTMRAARVKKVDISGIMMYRLYKCNYSQIYEITK